MSQIDASLAGAASPAAEASLVQPRLFGLALFGIFLVAVLLTCNLLGDPDTHWHVATGRWIIENRGWPTQDGFSHTFLGQPWIAKEWLSQVVMHGAYAAAGWPGVAFLGAAAIAGSLAALAGWLSRRLAPLMVANLVLLVFLLSSASLLSRPHVVALPLMMIWVLGVLDAAERGEAPGWLLVPVMLLWANAHAGYTIGFVIAGVLALEAMRAAGPRWLPTALRWGAVLGAAFLASCLTPYGYEALLVTQKLFAGGGREAIAHVEEWRSIEFDLPGVVGVLLLVLLLAGLALQPWRNVFRIALVVILGWMMVRHARFALLFAFAAVPIAMGAIAAGPLGARLAAASSPASRLRPGFAAIFAAATIALGAALSPTVKINPETTPVEALEAARRLGLVDEGRVYNTYNFGGYLIAQRVPTFIDGRTDQLFLGGFFDTFVRTRRPEARAEFLEHLRRHNVSWALVKTGSPEARNLEAAGWVARHSDEIGLVLTPPSN